MYRVLFDLAGLAIIAWLLLFFLPTWRVTRWIAETAVFPIFLAVLYTVGVVASIAESGVGFMADFGSADGVIGLLATEPVALIAWIHILAFDQVVGLLIYRDNMRHRFVPLPVQSVILFATLMLGPVGFLTYVTIRMARQKGPRVAWGEAERVREERAAEEPPVLVPQFATVVPSGSPLAAIRDLLALNRPLVAMGLLGLALAAATAVRAAVNGSWLLGQEGRLLEAAKFDGAVGIYVLTLALILPLAPWSDAKRRRWVAWTLVLLVYSYGIETIQAWRGIDPRFSTIGTPIDNLLGGVFFLAALGVLLLFVQLMRSFFREDAIPDHPALRLSLRYAAGGAAIAFGVGILMSIAFSGRAVGAGGDLMLIHAAGFHGLQALPLVALLLGAGLLREIEARRIVHLAGIGWLALCIGLTIQALAGQPTLTPTLALGLAGAGILAWLASLAMALRLRFVLRPALG